ncbi:MAG TPA: hypothetical protein VFH63_04280 [candidate division Zixibacteria bacterium]|nr:hypothetical protein [candidate division Zixibacteria bacterium]
MTASPIDPRTEDTIVYELVRTNRATGAEEPAGRAIFSNGRTRVEADENVRVAVEELLARAFVDRVEADERPRGYRRSGRPMVDMLVPGMPEHFIARMRGLWLPYPDGTVVTAREAGISRPRPGMEPSTAIEPVEAGPPVTDASVRRATLADSETILNVRPLLRANPPLPGVRPPEERRGIGRTDCGWLV